MKVLVVDVSEVRSLVEGLLVASACLAKPLCPMCARRVEAGREFLKRTRDPAAPPERTEARPS